MNDTPAPRMFGALVPIDPKYAVLISPQYAAVRQIVDGRNTVHVSQDVDVRIVKYDRNAFEPIEAIPPEEPVMLFRARDALAVPMLRHYRELAVADGCTQFHLEGIDNRIGSFEAFARQHPERMKQPGVTEGK